MRRVMLFILLVLSAVAYGADDVMCPTITLTADKLIVKPDSSVELKAMVENGSGYYIWLKNDEEVTEESPMSLGEFELYYSDELVSDVPATVIYKILLTNKQCEVSKEIEITVAEPLSANEHGYDGTDSEAVIYNMAGVRVYEPLTQSGIYIVKRGGETYKLQVK